MRFNILHSFRTCYKKRRDTVRISDPNKLVGKIIKIKTGEDMTEIIVDVGDQAVTATITSGAAGEMNLNEGDEIFAVFNSTSGRVIMYSQDSRRDYEISRPTLSRRAF